MAGYSELFRRADYAWWVFGDSTLALSSSLAIANSMLLVDVSGEPALAGLLVGVINSCGLLAAFLGGGLADRRSRRKIIGWCMNFAAVAELVLAGVLIGMEFLHLGANEGPAPVGALVAFVVLLLCTTFAVDFSSPAEDAALKNIVTPAEFPRAMSLATGRSNVLSIAGSPLAGALYALHPAAVYFVRSGGFAGMVLALRNIKRHLGPREVPPAREDLPTPQEPSAHEDSAEFGPDVADDLPPDSKNARESVPGRGTNPRAPRSRHGFGGFVFLSSNPVLRRIAIAAPLINLALFLAMQTTVFAGRSGGQSTLTIGIIYAGFAIGGLAGSFVAPKITDTFPIGRVVLWGLNGMALALLAFSFAVGNPWAMFALGAVAMLPSAAVNGGLFGYVFAVTPESLQGRVQAAFLVIAGLGNVLAAPLAGGIVAVGSAWLLSVAVLLTSFAAIALLASSPDLRGLARLEDVYES
ncbi:Major Facilitator Superfamily protein [Actinobaculum suis]|nr:Major Facilitator Superfamily protein [Actinobaculum suis]